MQEETGKQLSTNTKVFGCIPGWHASNWGTDLACIVCHWPHIPFKIHLPC